MSAIEIPLLTETGAASARSGNPAVADYQKARIVARVLISERLRGSARWCDLAKRLVNDPGVTDRLIDQAVRWFALHHREKHAANTRS